MNMASDSKNSYGLNNGSGMASGPSHLNGRIVAHPLQAVKASPTEP
jgi:hypothetical protein